MNHKRFRCSLLPLSLGFSLTLLIFMIWQMSAAGIVSAGKDEALISEKQSPSFDATLNRPEDPVIVAGLAFTQLISRPISELRVLAYDAVNWQPVPFQIDERAADGSYVAFEDGLLDANDELVLMAKDMGMLAGEAWPDDTEARQNPRYLISATDPLTTGSEAWVYLYQSTTLTKSNKSYVQWNETLQTITAISYTASFSPSSFVGLADISVNGNGVDILDRQKIRLKATIPSFPAPIVLNYNEEELTAFINPTISIPVIGPVRGLAGGGGFNAPVYGTSMAFDFSVGSGDLPIPLSFIDELRLSLDLNDPSTTSINQYYDSNGTAETIDGSPDSVPDSPQFDWYQSSGPAGGLVVSFPTVNAGGGVVSNYYKDDNTVDPDDTGDGRSYADAGLEIADPGNVLNFALALHVLPPNSSANVGATYYDRLLNPLETAATAERYGYFNYMPAITNMIQ